MQQAGQPSAQDELILSIAAKERSEALENETKAGLNISNANLNQAKAAEIMSGIQRYDFEAANKAINDQYKRRQESARLLLSGA